MPHSLLWDAFSILAGIVVFIITVLTLPTLNDDKGDCDYE